MKRLLLFLSIIFVKLGVGFAQKTTPVKWQTSVEKKSSTEYVLIATAAIDEGWHLYSQHIGENGPEATIFSFAENANYNLVGKTKEENGAMLYDSIFNMKIKSFTQKTTFKQRISLKESSISEVKATVTFMTCNNQRCLPPKTEELLFNLVEKTEVTAAGNKDSSFVGAAKTEKKGLFTIFLIAFLSGFAALLTPCVFPMIPMTVSFFTKQSKTRAKGIQNAFLYGLFIIVIYVFLGAIVTWLFGASALNAISTNVWFNLIFFGILVVFAVSFLGAFEIVLPYSWANKVDKQASRGGLVGIFFMALALAIVSFSCTGPIVGTLLVEAASKGGVAPFVGMLGFSSALALPFGLFAAFPGWLNSMPKSGGWLNTVKVFLGFLELALAFKFLSNADLVLQLHLLQREVFLAIWIAIFGTLAFYLFGKIKLPHDGPEQHISVGRLSMGMLVLAFTIYLIPGLWGARLELISGFPPPINYSESPYGVGYTKNTVGAISETSQIPEGAHLGPIDIIAFKDYETGLAYAKKVKKPVLLDFTGYACVNCRKMEERVWSDPKILALLKNEVVLISLYVDDKRKLPEDEQVVSEITGKKLKYIGQKWSEFQTLRYKANAQPFYVLMNLNEENLIAPIGYTPAIDEYLAWLREGIERY
ncbi:protein-disulfide reductase DsbD family protein [Galbibacter mesophilus]|uniref:protein-disulfide reductase DsbD family protein n=1 Tax=Galbibacter mesophilus TaxID=379069 RepID=UPI00191E8AAE|nr:thioredoxin family protein [Galbibacter mesophilus]MCM5662663.1 thioredoxin family protein [Galbibacter mesophilus]